MDPRGRVVFDEPISKTERGAAVPLTVDAGRLRARLDSLRTLAENTDGLAIVDSNNLDAGMKRVAADLSSYYLRGYYSNSQLEGKYHAITLPVQRPGVQGRARRGCLAAPPEALSRSGSRSRRRSRSPRATTSCGWARARVPRPSRRARCCASRFLSRRVRPARSSSAADPPP